MPVNYREQTVLIVDDLREMRMSVRAMVDALQVKQVCEAKSAEEARLLLTKTKFDMVLCDYNLGDGKDGQQLFEEAQAERLLPSHAIWIMITAENTMNMVMGVVEHHPDGYLVKPINKAVLQVRLERVLARKAIVMEIEAALLDTEFERARELCDQQLAKYPGMRADLLRMKAEALLRTGALDAASEICAEVLNEREVPWAMLYLARARHQSGDLQQAKGMLARLLEQHPTTIEGYEALARIEHEQGDPKAAQRVLAQAIAVSPRSIRRQQRLADLAQENADFATAEKAYRRALQMGENSCFGRPEDQAGVIEAVTGAKGPAAGLKILNDLGKRGRRAEVPHWRLGLVEARLLHASGEAAGASAVVARTLEQYHADSAPAAATAILDLIKICYQCGHTEAAQKLADKLVRENHDRQDVIAKLGVVYEVIGLQAEGAALIEQAQNAVVAINNRGVQLAKGGDYAAAIKLLTQAADELPSNLTVTLNVLQALMLQIKVEGITAQRRMVANEYLGRAMRIAPTAEKVLKLRQQILVLGAPPASQQAKAG